MMMIAIAVQGAYKLLVSGEEKERVKTLLINMLVAWLLCLIALGFFLAGSHLPFQLPLHHVIFHYADQFWVEKKALMYRDGIAKVRTRLVHMKCHDLQLFIRTRNFLSPITPLLLRTHLNLCKLLL